MGCRESKMECPEGIMSRRKSNVSPFSRLPGETDTPLMEVDPRSPLDAREIYRLKASWKGIRRNMELTGVEMFINLFRSDAEILHLFQGFTHIEGDALRENETLEAHAMLVMNTLDKAITNMENYDFVVDSLLATGANHVRFPGFEDKYFRYMEEPFLKAIRLTLGDRYTERIDKLYRLTIDLILGSLQRGMREANEELNAENAEEEEEEEKEEEEKKLNENSNSNNIATPTSDVPPTEIIVNT